MEWKQSIHWWIIRHCQSFSRVENLEAGVVTHEKSPLPFPVHGRAACPDQSPPSVLGLSHTIYEALGHQPINSPGNSLQGQQRCKSPPLRTYTLTQLSPQPLDLDTRGADAMNEKGQKDQQGRRGNLGESGMVGVGGRGMTQEAEPLSCAPIRQISSVLIASWPSGAPPGCFPWDWCWRRSTWAAGRPLHFFKVCEILCSPHPAASSWFRGSTTPKSLMAAGHTSQGEIQGPNTIWNLKN